MVRLEESTHPTGLTAILDDARFGRTLEPTSLRFVNLPALRHRLRVAVHRLLWHPDNDRLRFLIREGRGLTLGRRLNRRDLRASSAAATGPFSPIRSRILAVTGLSALTAFRTIRSGAASTVFAARNASIFSASSATECRPSGGYSDRPCLSLSRKSVQPSADPGLATTGRRSPSQGKDAKGTSKCRGRDKATRGGVRMDGRPGPTNGHFR
jgi:hypothetical protein